MKTLIDDLFDHTGEGSGTWILNYGEITDDIEYSNDNFIAKDKTIGYCRIITKKKIVIHIFISRTAELELVTSTGIQEGRSRYKNIVFNSVSHEKPLEDYYNAHLALMKEHKVEADRKYFEKELKSNAFPSRLYEIVKAIAIEKLQHPELYNDQMYEDKYRKYLQFIDEKFVKVSKGKGEWVLPCGDSKEKIKYEVENFINKDDSIGYCKVSRKDGLIVHVFISHFADKDILTASSLYTTQVQLDNILFNTVDMHTDLENHYLVHMKSFQGQTPQSDRKYIEKIVGKNELADSLYGIIKKAVIKTMGLSNLWSSEKIDNIIRKYLKKAITK